MPDLAGPWPSSTSVAVYAHASGPGPVGPRLGNTYDGWFWGQGSDRRSDVFPTKRAAQRDALSTFSNIIGWMPTKPGAHHITIAVVKSDA